MAKESTKKPAPAVPTAAQIESLREFNRQVVSKRPTKCGKCDEQIYFLKTIDQKMMPVNARRISVLGSDGRIVTGYEPHFGSCAGAGS